ncbi:flagellar hook-length control protein FliK [Pseudaminobacter arsenicus]|uniref:Flagellar hook-length control protein FliK n=1 Tax=Borborobacter arsenicus TaxID=1851146 RepID=A0A432V5W0_9HYPH|nr:flagellar hook-length control protein FliK [Pseudaminobacter arsenicus]RUM97535.1 flagellar hook-length control protein FliK [Pseudaminobacter arsenicus]
MTMPISNAPAGAALAKTGTDKHGSKDWSGNDAFGALIRVPTRTKALPQKPGVAAEPTRLQLFQPVGKLEDAFGKTPGNDSILDETPAEIDANADRPDPETAKDNSIKLPAAHSDPVSADTNAAQPQIAASDQPRMNKEPGGNPARGLPAAAAPTGTTVADKARVMSGTAAAASSNSMPEMPGAKFPAARPEIIHVTHPAQQGETTISDIERTLQSLGDELRTTTAASGVDQPRTSTPGRLGDWKGERFTVVAQQNIPAPVAQPTATTASALVSMLAGDPGWREAAAPAFQPLAARPNLSSAHSLKIQLHPAELGMVTASLRLTGEHMTVELRVENQDAYQRLNADSEIIVKSMRALGLDIDKVTVQQPQPGAQTQTRADGPASSSSSFTARGQDMSGQAGSGGSAGGGGHQSGRSGSDATQGSGNAASNASDRAGSDIYI